MRRSMLFLPGNSPNILLNADFLGSDSIILDLEDAVSPAEKDSARILVRNAIRTLNYTREVIVRINPTMLAILPISLSNIVSASLREKFPVRLYTHLQSTNTGLQATVRLTAPTCERQDGGFPHVPL